MRFGFFGEVAFEEESRDFLFLGGEGAEVGGTLGVFGKGAFLEFG